MLQSFRRCYVNGLRHAVLWSAVDRFGQQGAQFVLYVVLARLLSPTEYGLVGMLAVFFGVAQVFADSGLSSGLVQRRANSDDDETTVFGLNVTAGVVLTLALCALSPLVAHFYKQPILRPLLCVASCQVLISSFGIVQFALLMRAMDFRRQAIISMTAVCLSGGVAIGMALRGMGVWSLVGQTLTSSLTSTTLVWVTGTWRPRGRFRWQSLREMWPFGSNLLASGVLFQVCENLYSITIGRLFAAAALGLYTRANQMVNFPAMIVAGIVNRVAYPHFSRLQDDPAQLLANLRRVIRLTLTVDCLLIAALTATADQVVTLLLTPKWLGCVPYIRILCVAGFLLPLHLLHLSALTAQGRSGLFLRLEVIKRVLQVATLALTWRYGVSAMVVGYACLSVVSYFINAFYNKRLLGYHWWLQAQDVLPIAAAGVVAGLAAWSIGGLRLNSVWTQLPIQLVVVTGVYAAIAFLMRARAFADAWRVVGDAANWVRRRQWHVA